MATVRTGALASALNTVTNIESVAPSAALPEPPALLHRVVWKLAWPSVLTMLLQVGNSFLDRFFVGSLGPDALAAVGVGSQLMFVLFSVGMSVAIGATALVARFTGAGEPEDARIAACQATWVCLIGAFLGMAILLPLRVPVVKLLGVDDHAASLCVHYLVVTLMGVPSLFLMLVWSSVFRGLGDTMRPLLVMVGVNLVHLTGDYLIIFGHYGFPRLGLVGGAVALVASQFIGAGLYYAFLCRSPVAGFLKAGGGPNLEWARRILRIGSPAAFQNVSRNLSMLTFTSILTRTPEATAAVAALTIGLTSESVAFMPGFGFSTAASTLAGQSLGAKQPERAERASWAALQQGLAVMCLMAYAFYRYAPTLVGIFTHDSKVLPLAVAYLHNVAYSEPLLAVGMILTGALNGAGETAAPAWASVFSMWAIRLPLAFLLAHTLRYGAIGGWWSMAISTMINGVIVFALFKAGRWKSHSI